MKTFFLKYDSKPLITAILFFTMFMYALLYVHIYRHFPDIANGHDLRWTEVAEYIAREGKYTTPGGYPFPTAQTPPVFPLAYALSFKLFGFGRLAHEVMRIVQIAMSVGLVYIAYAIGKLLNGRAGIIAAALAALDLSTFFFANNYENPDVVVGFFAALAILYFLRFFSREQSYRTIIFGSIFLSLSFLTKPILHLFWVPLLGILCIFLYRKRQSLTLKKWIILVLFVGIMGLSFGGWKFRNYIATGYSSFSSQSGFALLWYASALKAYQEGMPFGEAQGLMKQEYLKPILDLPEGQMSLILEEQMTRVILASPFDFMMTGLRNIPGTLLGAFPPYILYSEEAVRDISDEVTIARGNRSLLRSLLGRGYYTYIALYGLAKLHLIIVYVLSLIAFGLLWRRKADRWMLIVLILYIAYVMTEASIPQQQRYRTSLMPVFYAFAGSAIVLLQTAIIERRRKKDIGIVPQCKEICAE